MKNTYKCEIITLGDELNRGEVIDTNASFIGEQLTQLGFTVAYRQGARDDQSDIESALSIAGSRSQLVIVSGGLGPTEDDVTVDAACAFAGVNSQLEEEHRQKIISKSKSSAWVATNLRQARIPVGSTALPNSLGAAPGFRMEVNRCTFFFLPGVPSEMKSMFHQVARPQLLELSPLKYFHNTYRIFGLGESQISHLLNEFIPLPAPLRFRYRFIVPEVLVSIEIPDYIEESEQLFRSIDEKINVLFGSALYSTGDKTLVQGVGEQLRARNETVSAAESCTGGLLGVLLTDESGSSDYYQGGVIAYDNKVKRNILGVSDEILNVHGAVSEECVRAMARAIREQMKTTYGLAISGVAGPGGGTEEKPVGTIWIGLCTPTQVKTLNLALSGDRQKIRQSSAMHALNLLRGVLSE